MDRELFKIAEEQIDYITNKKFRYNDKRRTRFIRERANDRIKSQTNGVNGAIIGAGAGLGASMASSKLTSEAYKRAKPEVKKAIENITKDIKRGSKHGGKAARFAANVLTNPTLRRATKWTGGLAAGAALGYLPGRTIGDMADLEKQSRKSLKREPTEDEYNRVAKFSNNGKDNPFAEKYMNSPSSIVQSNKRKRDATFNKQASDYNKAVDGIRTLLKALPENKKIINSSTIGSGLVGAAAGGRATHKVTPEEDKHKNLKTIGGTLVGGATGVFLGNRYAKNIADAKDFAIKSLEDSKEAKNDLGNLVKEQVEKRKEDASKLREEIEKRKKNTGK